MALRKKARRNGFNGGVREVFGRSFCCWTSFAARARSSEREYWVPRPSRLAVAMVARVGDGGYGVGALDLVVCFGRILIEVRMLVQTSQVSCEIGIHARP